MPSSWPILAINNKHWPNRQPWSYLLERPEDVEKLLGQANNRLQTLSHQPQRPQVVTDNLGQVRATVETWLTAIQTATSELLEQEPH